MGKITVDTGRIKVSGEVKNIGETLKKAMERRESQIPLTDFNRLTEWLKENIVVKSKREIVRNPKETLSHPIVVITHNGAPDGVYISFNAPAEIPSEVKLFLLGVLNAATCKGREK